jgi:hypothetical protein
VGEENGNNVSSIAGGPPWADMRVQGRRGWIIPGCDVGYRGRARSGKGVLGEAMFGAITDDNQNTARASSWRTCNDHKTCSIRTHNGLTLLHQPSPVLSD